MSDLRSEIISNGNVIDYWELRNKLCVKAFKQQMLSGKDTRILDGLTRWFNKDKEDFNLARQGIIVENKALETELSNLI